MKLRAPTSVEAFLLAIVVIVGFALVTHSRSEERSNETPKHTSNPHSDQGDQGHLFTVAWLG
jgi:hypothetical protein